MVKTKEPQGNRQRIRLQRLKMTFYLLPFMKFVEIIQNEKVSGGLISC